MTNMKTYLTKIEIPIGDLILKIQNLTPKLFLQCTIEDLLPDPNVSIGVGVYFFYGKDGLEYIGKSGGRNIIERLGGHIDHRNEGIMNYYLRMLSFQKAGRKWTKHKDWHDFDDNQHRAMLIDVMPLLTEKKLAVLYLGTAVDGAYLESLEALLSSIFKPSLQKFKSRDFDGKLVSDLIKKTVKRKK